MAGLAARLTSLVIGLVLLAVLPAAAESAYNSGQRRVALVIGVGAYSQVAPLPNPPNDARAVASSLRELGFDVTELIDPSHAQMRLAEPDFVDRLIDADVALLFYAGHSIQIDGSSYLVPTDAGLTRLADVPGQMFELSRIVNRMDRLAKTKIIILDACRDNPFLNALIEDSKASGNGVQVSQGLATMDRLVDGKDLQPTELDTYGTVVAYAAAPGKVALDGDGINSPYTTALLRHIGEPGLEIGRLFRQVAADVIEATKGSQKPEYLVKLTGEFHFLNPQPGECDFLAAEPLNNLSIKGVDFDAINTAKAIPACRKALEADPENPRLAHNLARALDAAHQYEASIPFYQQAAEKGYIHAVNNLGVMYINGQGVKQDFAKGNDLLKQARSLGHLQARVNMQGTDFSVLFKAAEFAEVQKKLIADGYLKGKADGNFGTGSKAALQDYQRANKLAEKGISLETLDHMDLVTIIPAFSLR
ncbi:MAG: caspase family protein [Notoacmeibacter sp.]|nr:caspase family protein [Notoacmeibacter sp.]